MNQRKRYTAEYDDAFYWKRVRRNLGWLGNTIDEQRKNQLKLRDVVVGVAGCGGIGGAIAERLARMGVRHLKVADPDTFEVSNINRQYGAEVDNLGRNKAEVTAELIYQTTRDVNIDVFPEGITAETVDEFVEGCDYILDKIELYEINSRYKLHRSFRRSARCNFMATTPVFGNRTFFFKWTHDSMPAEEYFGIEPGSEMNEENARRLISRFIPEMPEFPSSDALEKWFIENMTCPIFAATPPLAQGMLASRLGLAITGLDQLPGVQQLPATPGYSMIDTEKWIMKTVEGKWW
ncbi:ThiF family adenylyltransferase [Actinopolyspora mortivallis]|uniref:ThiF family adenylyltransferase n=1 Tax=Actinopolyspora mortivallis TaxID=33906 RepID=UPI00047B0825|nr:ThiF family adenylyltransferase [Actinopolyspora mortivallis]